MDELHENEVWRWKSNASMDDDLPSWNWTMNVEELVIREAMLNNYACMDDDGLLSGNWSMKVKAWVTNEDMINNYDGWPSWKWSMTVRS